MWELEALYEQPEIQPAHLWIWKAFHELTTERDLGFGVGPIPWQRIREYGDREGLDESEFETFREVIRALDTEYLKHANKPRDGDAAQK